MVLSLVRQIRHEVGGSFLAKTCNWFLALSFAPKPKFIDFIGNSHLSLCGPNYRSPFIMYAHISIHSSDKVDFTEGWKQNMYPAPDLPNRNLRLSALNSTQISNLDCFLGSPCSQSLPILANGSSPSIRLLCAFVLHTLCFSILMPMDFKAPTWCN